MASTLNAFDLLKGQGEQVASKANKKKKSKPKKPAEPAADAPAAPAQAAETDVAPLVAEASAILEKSARTFKAGADRIKLWKDWVRQVRDRQAPGPTTSGSVHLTTPRPGSQACQGPCSCTKWPELLVPARMCHPALQQAPAGSSTP